MLYENSDKKAIAEFDALCFQFAVGDRVKVINRMDNDAILDGWQLSWINEMDEAVGNEYTVEDVHAGGWGIGLEFGLEFCYFPPQVLQKV